MRGASDRLCREHSRFKYQTAQNGTSYKVKLKAAIDWLIPVFSRLEALLVRLQWEGYEIKRRKYISARAPDQERFTRLKTLGAGYVEEAVTSRIAGGPKPSRKPRQCSGKVNLLTDIQNNIQAQQNAGYQRWATIENLKRGAATMNFLAEHSIAAMRNWRNGALPLPPAPSVPGRICGIRNKESPTLPSWESKINTCRKLKPVYDRSKVSKDKGKFLQGFESEIILFEAAAKRLCLPNFPPSRS